MRKRRLRMAGAAFVAAIALFWALTGWHLERFVNRVEPVQLPEVTPAARALHASSTVIDLHADSLLFRRDLRERSAVGHVDLPRLREGGVGLQVFTTVTVVPMGIDVDRTEPPGIDLLSLADWARLSSCAWQGPLCRALDQAARLRAFVEASDGQLLLIRDLADLAKLLERRRNDPQVVGALLGAEGAHAMQGDPANLDALFEAGFRMIGLTHFFDNEYGGSAHGVEKGRLSELGRATLLRMEELGILVDLAHLAPAAIEEALDLLTKPTVVSHGGVKGTCNNLRTLSDAHVRRIAAGGGVVGIGYWETAVCGTEPRHVVDAIRYVVDLVGDDHVALGSDYDGATTVGFDTSRLPALTQALIDANLPEESIRKILGGNVLRVLEATLPRTRALRPARKPLRSASRRATAESFS
jgi:microsomal dipeptidase-like Zn-dependent dipeptidase